MATNEQNYETSAFAISCRETLILGTVVARKFVQLSVRGDGFFYSLDDGAKTVSTFESFDSSSMRFLVPLQKVVRLHD